MFPFRVRHRDKKRTLLTQNRFPPSCKYVHLQHQLREPLFLLSTKIEGNLEEAVDRSLIFPNGIPEYKE